MKLYKLVDQNYTTYNGSMQWKFGKLNKLKKSKNPQLRSNDVIHAYKNKNLALLLNPIHAQINDPIILECEGTIVIEDSGECGVFELTPIKKSRCPKWYLSYKKQDVQIMFAILCAEFVIKFYENKYYDGKPRKAIEAAKKYLNNKSDETSKEAARAAVDASDASFDAACFAAHRIGYKAAGFVDIAVGDDYWKKSGGKWVKVDPSDIAAYAAARAASRAARAVRDCNTGTDAALAAAYAAGASGELNFCELADKAVKIIMQQKFTHTKSE